LLAVLLSAQNTFAAAELWKRTGTTLEPNEPNDSVNTGSGNITTTGTITGGNVTASTITGDDFGYISCADISATGTVAGNNAAFGQNFLSGPGNYAVMFGFENVTASGDGSLAGGVSHRTGVIEASGMGSFAMGYNQIGNGDMFAKGDGSMAFGYPGGTIEANGPGSIAMGYGDVISGGAGSIAMGNGPRAFGSGSIALGCGSQTLNECSVAIGNSVIAGPNQVTLAFGSSFTNNTAESFAVGFGQADFEVWSGNTRVNGDLEVTGAVKGTIGEEKEVFFEADYADNLGDLRTRNVGGTSLFRFTFRVPSDFVSLVSLKLQGYISAGAAQNNRDIDLDSDYGGAGEAYNNHSESDPNSTYNLSTYSGKLYEFDISGLFNSPGITAGDTCGLKASHNNLGGVIDYTGIVLKYKNY
jgi:hypothetical protein